MMQNLIWYHTIPIEVVIERDHTVEYESMNISKVFAIVLNE